MNGKKEGDMKNIVNGLPCERLMQHKIQIANLANVGWEKKYSS